MILFKLTEKILEESAVNKEGNAFEIESAILKF